jgi:hypothetical protein
MIASSTGIPGNAAMHIHVSFPEEHQFQPRRLVNADMRGNLGTSETIGFSDLHRRRLREHATLA